MSEQEDYEYFLPEGIADSEDIEVPSYRRGSFYPNLQNPDPHAFGSNPRLFYFFFLHVRIVHCHLL